MDSAIKWNLEILSFELHSLKNSDLPTLQPTTQVNWQTTKTITSYEFIVQTQAQVQVQEVSKK